jgi:hypothetical protein
MELDFVGGRDDDKYSKQQMVLTLIRYKLIRVALCSSIDA